MSKITRTTDMIYAYRFIRLMQKPFTEWKAHGYGIIDDQGKVLRRPKTDEEKTAYTSFHASIRSMKRMMNTVPGLSGMSALASAFSATAGRYGITESQIEEICEACPEIEAALQEMVAGDSGGSTTNIATGKTTGAVTNKGPAVVGKKKSRKELAESVLGRSLKKAVKKVRRKFKPSK
ncbi:hypothetical protein [Serratia phage SP1]|nr:hypothetical protein [Serratia phage SP1]